MMFRTLLAPKGVWPEGISVIRITTGILLIIHGMQLFKAGEMSGYGKWLSDIGIPFPLVMAYTGKAIEMAGGFCFVAGVFVRLAASFLFLSFMFIAFVMGEGKILTDAQHPFLFALLSLVFLFTGTGKFSVASLLDKPKK
jgi:putative oxidoreductase